jgi:hypothetical protein
MRMMPSLYHVAQIDDLFQRTITLRERIAIRHFDDLVQRLEIRVYV